MTAAAPSPLALLASHWELQWPLDLTAAAILGLYAFLALRLRTRWSPLRTAAFAAGLGVVLVALQSGVAAYDDRLLSAHMVQHMLLLLVAPLLLLAGQPVMLVLRALPAAQRPVAARGLSRIARYTRPVPCLAVFYAVLLLTHLPGFYDATLTMPALHELEHALYLGAGLLLWWPILDADPAPFRRLGGLGRLVYMLAAMPPMALVGAYLNRHAALVYRAYGAPGHALGISAVTDQQQAGAIMWVAGNTMMVAVGLWAVIAALVAEERRQQAREARATPPTAAPVRGAGARP